ncbi:MAG: dienelactone hydrolase family protein [Actinomycetota bacterium]
MSVKEIEIPSPASAIRGLLGEPEGIGPFPVVVVIHEAFGIDDSMKAQVEKLTSLGYLAIMPDLFSRGGARKCLTATFRALVAQQGQAFEDIAAARNFAQKLPKASEKVGVIGFCMGGSFALVLAGRGYDVSSVNYGRLPANLDETLAGACPVVASFGSKDKSLPDVANKLESSLNKNLIIHDVKEYEGAGHAFLNPYPAGPKIMQPVLRRFLGVSPQPEAAADAWKRIDDFFKRFLS